MFDMINIFDVFLPQLLMYPNPTDPLNPEAAAMMLKRPAEYERKVRDHVCKHAKPQASFNIIIEDSSSQNEKQKDLSIEEEDEENFDEDDSISLGDVSELSDTSDIELEEC